MSCIISLKNGRGEAIVDDEDYTILVHFPWHFSSGYASCAMRVDGKDTIIPMHRLIMNAPVGMVVDHINHNKLDNRKCNLRIVTVAENNRNLSVCDRKKTRWRPSESVRPPKIILDLRERVVWLNEEDKDMAEEYLRIADVANRLGVTRQAVYNWIKEGRLPAVRFGTVRGVRIPRTALEEFERSAAINKPRVDRSGDSGVKSDESRTPMPAAA